MKTKNTRAFVLKGEECPSCTAFVPKFDFTNEQQSELNNLIVSSNQKAKAMKLIIEFTGCEVGHAKAWINHPNGPTPIYSGPPCPKCNQPIRTKYAKQCPHCFETWHDN